MKNRQQLLLVFLIPAFILSCQSKDPNKSNPAISDTLHRVRQEKMTNPYSAVDVSPMDMAYFPVDFPKLKSSDPKVTTPVARVIYSRPHLEGRHLFKDLLKYDESWRLGANESTELQLYKDVSIQGKKVKAGRYVLYCIPHPDKWTIILNNNIDSWGLEPDSTKDVFHFDIPVAASGRRVEYFTMIFEKTKTGAQLLMAWDQLEARLPIDF